MFRAAHGIVNFKFQTDNGEFKSAKCRESIESCAGKLITNASYSPETMAIIERSWLTIGEMASVMDFNADLGEQFWKEATSYAVNIYNRIPPSNPDSRVYESHRMRRFIVSVPSLQILCLFGAAGMHY